MRRQCLALDLVDDEEKIATYIKHHRRIWPEIASHIRATGVLDMQIWHLGTRLFMVMDVADNYDEQHAAALAETNPKVEEWEALMWQFQVPTPWAKQGQKWVEMTQIFSLADQ